MASHMLNTVLELLAVHPDHQRLGAGTALVKWGTKAADEQGLKVMIALSFFLILPTFLSLIDD